MPMTNRDAVFGQCYRDAPIKRICYNNCILSISEFGGGQNRMVWDWLVWNNGAWDNPPNKTKV